MKVVEVDQYVNGWLDEEVHEKSIKKSKKGIKKILLETSCIQYFCCSRSITG